MASSMPRSSGPRRSAAPASWKESPSAITRAGRWRSIARLKGQGFTVLLVEQNFRFAATVADRHYVMDHGRVVDMIRNTELDANMAKLHDYLGV